MPEINDVILEFNDVMPVAQADEETMKQLVNLTLASNDAITVQSLDGTITVWNKGAEKMYGYLAEEAIGSNINMLVPKEEREQIVRIERQRERESDRNRETERERAIEIERE